MYKVIFTLRLGSWFLNVSLLYALLIASIGLIGCRG
jgi:hypothetical protein